MNRTARLAVAALALVVAAPAAARNDELKLPIADALRTPDAKAKLDPSIRLYFGTTPGGVERTIGETRTNKKTNSFNKTDKQACEWAFLGAVMALQAKARKTGGNAVVGIVSNYKDRRSSSATQYVCGVGNVVAGVAFKGTIVRMGR